MLQSEFEGLMVFGQTFSNLQSNPANLLLNLYRNGKVHVADYHLHDILKL